MNFLRTQRNLLLWQMDDLRTEVQKVDFEMRSIQERIDGDYILSGPITVFYNSSFTEMFAMRPKIEVDNLLELANPDNAVSLPLERLIKHQTAKGIECHVPLDYSLLAKRQKQVLANFLGQPTTFFEANRRRHGSYNVLDTQIDTKERFLPQLIPPHDSLQA